MHTALRLTGVVVAWCLLLPTSGAAEDRQVRTQTQQAGPRPSARSADFLFGRPKRSLGIRGNWLFASAGSDLFDFVTEHLTLDKEHFNAPGIGGDVAFALTPRMQLEVGVEMNRMERASEYRAFVDNDLRPIEQQTSMRTVQVGAGLRFALTPRGDDVSRLAWIPRRVVPFVGAGAGATRYEFRQSGDFVDFVDLSVFPDAFRSQGWAPTVYGLGGVDLQIHRALYATVQGRYTKASGELSSDFIDFDPIDLSGFRLSAGINFLF